MKGVTVVHNRISVALGRLDVLATATAVKEFSFHSNKFSKLTVSLKGEASIVLFDPF